MSELALLSLATYIILGASFGSFIAMLVSRRSLKLAVLAKPSTCDSCHSKIAWYKNIPLLSWPVLGGKCSHCKASIPIRYWLIELLTAIAFTVLWFSWSSNMTILGSLAAFLVVTMVISYWDIDTMKIPNPLVLIALAIAVVLGIAVWLADARSSTLISGLLGALSYSGLLGLVRLIKPGGMGLGDVKLALPLGAVSGFFGLELVAVSIFLAFLCGALIGLSLIALGKATQKSRMPFGPSMVLGFWLSLIFGEQLWGAYLEVIASVVN